MHYILILILAATVYYLQAAYYKTHWNHNLSATVTYNKTHANIGETILLTETVKNEKMLPVPVLYVKFSTSRTFLFENSDNAAVSDHYHRNDIFSVMGNQQITRTMQFRTTARGYYSTEHIDLVVNDLFMKDSYATKLDNHTSLYVYPALLTDQSSISMVSSIIGDLSRRDLYEDPLSFRGIREYTSNDSMRYINWKSTAKNQALMVNTYFDIQSTEVVILFNLDTNIIHRDQRLQEYMISVTATLLHHLNTKGFTTRLAINTEDPFTGQVITTDLGVGVKHLQSMLQILARLDLSKPILPFENFFNENESLFGANNHQTAYLIISNYRKEQLLNPYYDKREQGYKVEFICPEEPSLCSPIADIQYWEVASHEI